MRNFLIMSLGMFLMLSACKDKTVPTSVEGDKKFYGEKIDMENAITYDALLAKLESQETVENIKVKGTIESVCQMKGCWMNIVSETDPTKESMFVKFKDYAFFMPLDSKGSTAVMQGRAFKEETSVEELRHYAEDEGKSEEEIAKITEPVTELKFMADGVILY